jgi:hypothetical protein
MSETFLYGAAQRCRMSCIDIITMAMIGQIAIAFTAFFVGRHAGQVRTKEKFDLLGADE